MTDDLDDQMLVQRFARGDQAAFDQIVARHQDRVLRLTYRLLGWSDEAHDVVQEVFLRAYTGLRKFQGRSALATWLTRIAVNECRRQRRKRLLRLDFLRHLKATLHANPDHSTDDRPPDHETLDRVRRAVDKLPRQYREIVVLRYLEDMPAKEIRAVLGISDNVLAVRLNRARTRLKDALESLDRKEVLQ